MLTPEREQEIRERVERCHEQADGLCLNFSCRDTGDLLAEIDRLRENMRKIHADVLTVLDELGGGEDL